MLKPDTLTQQLGAHSRDTDIADLKADDENKAMSKTKFVLSQLSEIPCKSICMPIEHMAGETEVLSVWDFLKPLIAQSYQ